MTVFLGYLNKIAADASVSLTQRFSTVAPHAGGIR